MCEITAKGLWRSLLLEKRDMVGKYTQFRPWMSNISNFKKRKFILKFILSFKKDMEKIHSVHFTYEFLKGIPKKFK